MTKLATIILGLAMLTTTPASAQENQDTSMRVPILGICDLSEKIIAVINGKYGEIPMADGDGGMDVLAGPAGQRLPGKMTIWVNPETFSYTVTIEGPNGFHCIVSTGENFRPAEPLLENTL